MANAIAVVGDTGTGKTSSIMPFEEAGIIGLNPQETFIINIKDKPLPMKGWKNKYVPIKPGVAPTEGNYFASTDAQEIVKVMSYIGQNRPDIRNVVLDDGQYVMSEEFMANALKAGYDKFNKMAKNMYDVINTGLHLPKDKNFILLTHSEENEGKTDIKTLGKMLSDKVNLAGLFTIVLYTNVKTTMQGSTYSFVTNQHIVDRGVYVMAKSPRGMFPEKLIPNDMGYVLQKVEEYNNAE